MLGTMSISAAVPEFESVATSAEEVVPLGVLGKVNEEVSDAAGAVPVAVSDEV